MNLCTKGNPTCKIIKLSSSFFYYQLAELFKKLKHYAKIYGERYRVMIGHEYFVLVSNPEDCEAILTSPKVLEKSPEYYFLSDWLEEGLLLSHGHKWHQRRKILTHAFHFRILDDFTNVFDAQADVLIQKLAAKCGGPTFNIGSFVTLYTLDVICETAMGIKVDAQLNTGNDYVRDIVE